MVYIRSGKQSVQVPRHRFLIIKMTLWNPTKYIKSDTFDDNQDEKLCDTKSRILFNVFQEDKHRLEWNTLTSDVFHPVFELNSFAYIVRKLAEETLRLETPSQEGKKKITNETAI